MNDAPRGSWISVGSTPSDGDVVFVAQAAYHLDDVVAIEQHLLDASRTMRVVVPAPPGDLLRRLRSSWARALEVRARAATLGLTAADRMTGEDAVTGAAALVVRNDWGPARDLVEAARQRRIPTIGWVEGVQDFGDVDTGRSRHAYRSVDHVFCLGRYDASQLADLAPHVVGSQRLYRSWNGPPTVARIPLVVNLNFTYGVLEQHRRAWLAGVRRAAATARTPLVLTKHPADRHLVVRPAPSRIGADELLPQAARLVTRFSTLVYDALALGVDVVYFNPHGERVPTFSSPMGAFRTCRSVEELTAALAAPPAPPDEVRAAAQEFLDHHLVLEPPTPAERAAAAIRRLLPPS